MKLRAPTNPGEYWVHRRLDKLRPTDAAVWTVQWREPAGRLSVFTVQRVELLGRHETVYEHRASQPHGYIMGWGEVALREGAAICRSSR